MLGSWQIKTQAMGKEEITTAGSIYYTKAGEQREEVGVIRTRSSEVKPCGAELESF